MTTHRPAVVRCERCGVTVSAAGARAHARACERAAVSATPFQAACYRALLDAWGPWPASDDHRGWLAVEAVRGRVTGFGHVPSAASVERALAALERAIDADCRSGPVLSAWQGSGPAGTWLGFAPAPAPMLTAPARAWVEAEGLLDQLTKAHGPPIPVPKGDDA